MLWDVTGMILALPITATLKILSNHSLGYEAYGFLIGESLDQQIQNELILGLKKWKKKKWAVS